MRGFFKLITIGNEVRYGMKFSLEDVQQLCTAAFPLHTSSAGSNASFSSWPSRCAQPFRACAPAENAPSRSKRRRFTEEEDVKIGRFKGEEGLAVGRHSTFLSREEHRVATGALFYRVEGEKHCVIERRYSAQSKL
jgi:hypothetical protein